MSGVQPSELYKYLESRHVKSLLRGEVRVRNLRAYQELEHLGLAVGDPNEGTSTVLLRDGVMSGESLRPFFDAPAGATLDVRDCAEHTIHTDLYAVCFSSVKSGELMSRFSEENVRAGGEPYDACVEIVAPAKFARGLAVRTAANGLRYRGWGACDYAEQPEVPAGPLRAALYKGPDYAWQMEVRLVFQGRHQARSLIVAAPELGEYLREVRIER